MKRKQFTFYASYYDAVRELPKKDRSAVILAICAYALDEEEPNLTGTAKAVFTLIKPTLDTARRKAAGGMAGTPGKDNAKTSERQPKDSEKEKEKENEKEKEVEIEGEKEKEDTGKSESAPGHAFTAFWESYPSKIGRSAAWGAWKAMNPTEQTRSCIMAALEAWKKSQQWTEDAGRFIPRAAKFLSEGHWKCPPQPAQKKTGTVWASDWSELGKAELEAIQRVLKEDPEKRQLDEDERRAIAQLMADDEPGKKVGV